MGELPAPRRSKYLWLGCGLFLGLAIALTARQGLRYSSSDSFCDQACHAHPHATEMWTRSGHHSNKRGIVTHCTDCHLPPDGIRYLTEKAKLGAHDAYAQLFRNVSSKDWSRERQLNRALTFTYDASCIRCHNNLFGQGLSNVSGALPPAPQETNRLQIAEMKKVARRMEAHLYYQRNREKLHCINCHLFEGHRTPTRLLLPSPATETAEFPSHPEGFRNYTETVPGTVTKFHVIAVAGGTLEAGSPALGSCRQRDSGPVQTVNIGPFWMAQEPVNPSDLERFLAQNRRASSIARLTPEIALDYVAWLSHVTGKKYRLPTQVELEYACIAGSTMPAWENDESRASSITAELSPLNPWGFLELPSENKELTLGGAPPNPKATAWILEGIPTRFRVVRTPEAESELR